MGTDTTTARSENQLDLGDRLGASRHLVAEQSLRLFDAALQVAHGVHLGKINPDGDQCQGDLRRKAGDDDAGSHEP